MPFAEASNFNRVSPPRQHDQRNRYIAIADYIADLTAGAAWRRSEGAEAGRAAGPGPRIGAAFSQWVGCWKVYCAV
jgi:hypothetical protein